MIGHNTNYITVSEIIAALWDHWRNGRKDADSDDEDINDNTPMLSPNNHRPRMPPPPAPPMKNNKPPVPPKPPASPKTPTAPEKPPIEEFEMA